MAKPLDMPQPTSAVARLLEPGVGRAARSGAGRGPAEAARRAGATGEVPDIKREFILTRSADEVLERAVRHLARATGSSVSRSHFLRALLGVVGRALPELERGAAPLGGLRRPGNARGREAEREAYERGLADALHAGIRAGPPPR